MRPHWWADPADHCGAAIVAVLKSQTKHLAGKEKEAAEKMYRHALEACAAKFVWLSKQSWNLQSKHVAIHSRKIFRDENVRIAATLITHHRRFQRYGAVKSVDAAKQKAHLITKLGKQSEPIKLVKLPKSEGGYRRTYSFGPVRTAQQFILVWIIMALLPRNTGDYSLSGKQGVHGFAKATAKAIFTGYRFM
jgi:hypothetical protein